MIYKLDHTGCFVYCNSVFLAFFGLKEEDLLHQPYEQFVREDYRPRVRSFYETQLELKQTTSYFEVPIQLNNTRELWLGQTVEVILNEGEVVEFLVVARDISERVKATQSMLQSEQKYRSVIQNINLGLMEVDNDEHIVYVNEAFCSMMGYEAEELLGKKASTIFLDPTDTFQKKQIDKANKQRLIGKSGAYELRIKKKDGSFVWMIISGAPIKNGQGEIVGSLGIHNDITERKEQEFQRLNLLDKLEHSNMLLVEKEKKLRSVIDSALDAVISINEKGIVLEWNSQAEVIFGFTPKEAIGKSLSTLIIPENYVEAHEKGMKHFLKTGEGPVLQQRIEITGKHKTGKHFNVELSISPIKLKDEYVFSAFVRDITSRKQAENEMAQTLKKQQELNELRAKLVSITSHEFRTPLTTIKSNLDLLQYKLGNGSVEPQKLKRNFERMEAELNRLNHILSDILLIGRMESGKMPFKPKPVHYKTFINEVINQNFKPSKHRIRFKEIGEPWKPMLDVNMFSHVLINLISNALKYSEESVTLSLTFTEHNCTLEIKDKGIGIPQNDQNRLFESFFRATNAEAISGTGIGLNLVKQFCQQHKVQVSFISKEGVGSTFTLKHFKTHVE